MRLAKVESLRKDLEIMSQNHEREVDMKDAIIQMLDRDLDEAEEQYQMALRSHLQNVDALIDLYNSKVRQLESEFEDEIRQMQDDFQTERTEIVTKHAAAKGELADIIDLVEQQFKESEADAKQEFDSQCEELKNKNLEDRNVLKLMLEAFIETLENHFANAAETYDQTTRQRTQQFRQLTTKDRQSAQSIEGQLKKLQRLQDTLAHWRTKIASNVKECEERNRLMRDERDQISRHFQELKTRMNKMRDEQRARLMELSIHSRRCIKALEGQKQRAESILRYAELNRKLETDREKVLPFHPLSIGEDDATIPEELLTDATALSSYAIGPDGKPVEEWNYLDIFFKRYNKVRFLDSWFMHESLSVESSTLTGLSCAGSPRQNGDSQGEAADGPGECGSAQHPEAVPGRHLGQRGRDGRREPALCAQQPHQHPAPADARRHLHHHPERKRRRQPASDDGQGLVIVRCAGILSGCDSTWQWAARLDHKVVAYLCLVYLKFLIRAPSRTCAV